MNNSKFENKLIINIAGEQEGFCWAGVPFNRGEVKEAGQLKFQNNDEDIDCYARPLCFWDDGTIKWINLGFYHNEINSDKYILTISSVAESRLLENTEKEFNLDANSELVLQNQSYSYILDFDALNLRIHSRDTKKEILTVPDLSGTLDKGAEGLVTASIDRWEVSSYQNLANRKDNVYRVELEGSFNYTSEKPQLKFTTTLEIIGFLPLIKIQVCLHNPGRAIHAEGLWDLGDGGSEFIDAFSMGIEFPENSRLEYKLTLDKTMQDAGVDTSICQYASGGENWQSPVHIDKDGRIPLSVNGYKVVDARGQVFEGDRATPVIRAINGPSVTLEKFWQNFPASMNLENNCSRIGFFPLLENTKYEIQGGEKKTKTLWLDLSGSNLDWIQQPPVARPDSHWLSDKSLIPLFLGNDSEISTLISHGLQHDNNFFVKRETIDEYGWRNFGELYADHETSRYDGNELFVSHFNNQYDPIYGFLRQFLLTGKSGWFELANDLANHVNDIDIYDTTYDKAEYSGGLFWHTDHYVKAHTATHRSYSRHQESNAYETHVVGGGPGGQHCYTTGLALHYLLTGSDNSRKSVFKLAEWISSLYEGTDTILELLLALKNRDIPGMKNSFTEQYPFDRGTGNYIFALLDCYVLSNEDKYLYQVERIIKNTIHPLDDISRRNLSDIEGTWFYVVLLQALCRYLYIKEGAGLLDESFYYARDALLHYAEWMVVNEKPYLENREVLEFPNDTWTAQDLRKSGVLAAAWYYSTEKNPVYIERARYFQDYVIRHLSSSDELSYTRIQALLMQNDGAFMYYTTKQTPGFDDKRHDWPEAKYNMGSSLLTGVIKEMWRRLLRFSISNEVKWLKIRIGR